MKFIPNAVSSRVARQVLVAQKNSPAILFGAGIVGMVSTTVLACRATLRVEEVLEKTQDGIETVEKVLAERRKDYTEQDAKKDKLYIYIRAGVSLGRLYAPAIVCGGLTVAALTKSHTILNKRNAGLLAAYTAVEKRFGEYRDRVAEKYGREQEDELYYELEKCEIDDESKAGKKKTVKKARRGGSIYARFFSDQTTRSYSKEPEYNLLFLRAQQNFANDRLQSRGHVFLNEIYDSLGFERSSEGAVVGWIKGQGDDYIDFGIFDSSDMNRFYDFVTGAEGVWLDFNVDGVIYDKI